MDIESIKRDFELKGYSLLELRTELVKKMAAIHPDKNRGVFIDPETEERYYKYNDAIEFIDKQTASGTSLITVNDAKELIETFAKQLTQTTNSNDNEKIFSQRMDRSIGVIRKKFRVPKITTASATAVLSAMWVFPNQVKEHPVLGQLFNIESLSFTVIWLYFVLFTSFLWYISYSVEQSQERFLLNINTAFYQNQIFRSFMFETVSNDTDSENSEPIIFTKEHFIHFLMRTERNRKNTLVRLLHRPKMDTDIAESIADAVISKAEQKNLIKKVDSNSLEDEYIFVGSLDTSVKKSNVL
ncbi:hypothetical protein NST48_14235 [Paenibacillus sp. FSL M7-0547]|uniref:hypothetical protein n=1 Tax=Paenibacillus sp. FSL M7-0547 TaxID=2954755 RepID=UPI0030F97235